ncbi:MAG TPA: hypothetical protein VEJ89_02755 [Myxococcaceae bacterium]|jgi:hypothetical protein|nr:hypothetical protein [Myxococcaceae bacterium]
MRPPLLAALALALLGCRPMREDTPEAAYRAFATAAGRGDGAGAWARLTRESQADLNARVAGLGPASGGSLREDAPLLVFSGGRPPPLGRLRVLKRDGDRATLEVTAGDRTGEVTLLRQGPEWRVELPRGVGRRPAVN